MVRMVFSISMCITERALKNWLYKNPYKNSKETSGAFLAVLKNFGPGKGNMSFPKEGYTLALDFKATSRNISVGRELINIVNDLGGNIYLAKDAIMNDSDFIKNFNIKEFSKVRHSSICSEQSIRLNL